MTTQQIISTFVISCSAIIWWEIARSVKALWTYPKRYIETKARIAAYRRDGLVIDDWSVGVWRNHTYIKTHKDSVTSLTGDESQPTAKDPDNDPKATQ